MNTGKQSRLDWTFCDSLSFLDKISTNVTTLIGLFQTKSQSRNIGRNEDFTAVSFSSNIEQLFIFICDEIWSPFGRLTYAYGKNRENGKFKAALL